MNIILDVGNSLIKLAIFDEGELVDKYIFEANQLSFQVKKTRSAYSNAKDCIISSVGSLSKEQMAELHSLFSIHVLTYQSRLPYSNLYKTPTTLGVDRIALIAAAATQFPKRNVLVIDAGSAITYDFLNHKNQYLGGAIAPGIHMRYKALHQFTANLPLLEKQEVISIIGTSTEEAMHSGVCKGVLLEIDGAINEYKQQYADLTIILTGGDVDFLRDRLKNDIFANSNFLLEGLNYILEHNKD